MNLGIEFEKSEPGSPVHIDIDKTEAKEKSPKKR